MSRGPSAPEPSPLGHPRTNTVLVPSCIRSFPLFLGCLFVASAAHAQVTYDIPRGRTSCTRVRDYIASPSLSQLADSAALHASLRRVVEAEPPERRFVSAAIRFKPDGTLDRIEVGPTVNPALRRQLPALLQPLIRTQTPQPRRFEWQLQLEADREGVFELKVLPLLVCPPELTNGTTLGFMIQQHADRLAGQGRLGGPSGRVVMLRFSVLPSGYATEARVSRSSGDVEADRAAIAAMPAAFFAPGLVYAGTSELQPVKVLVEMPITFKDVRYR
jgi:TonB family protein